MKKTTLTETQEQTLLFEWADVMQGKYPELAMLFHVPNEGKRSYIAGKQLRNMGLKRGVPDVFFPVARGQYHGLAIEMKALNGKPTAEQLIWLDWLRRAGWQANVCHGWLEASECIETYIKG